MGLHLPLVYNSGGYDSTETLRWLDGVIDIYMPDMKYSEAKTAENLSGVKGYPEINRDAVREMHRQVGDLRIDNHGVAQRGLIVRHLVLPARLAGTEEVVRFLAQEVSTNTYVNIMAQYHPCYKAFDFPQLSRPIDRREFNEAIDLAIQYGLSRLDSPRPTPAVRFILG
jgi:putative pyruvate formate lyase activating enzyme